MADRQAIADKIRPVIDGLGYELVDVVCENPSGEITLTVIIDKPPEGVTLDDCERVHYSIDPVLDELDPTGGKPYTLNVSSPGLDRPFKTQRDFERNYGKEVEIKLYAPLKGKKVLEGWLRARTEHTLVFEDVTGTEQCIECSKIALVRPLIKFS